MLWSSLGKILTEYESKNLLSHYGIPITKEAVAKSPEEAVRIASRIGYPVALKVDSPDILHKTDVDVIVLNLHSENELIKAYHKIVANAQKYNAKAEIRGVLVQEMVKDAREVMVGMSRDPQFGPVIMFGLGGVFVEVLKDVSLRVAPLTRHDAEEIVREIKGHKILGTFRGKPEADIDGIIDTLLKLSKLSIDLQDAIYEIDINPLMVLDKGNGIKAVDALVVLR
jgi:acyl-CoA synthetase (NDP forming)